MIDRYPHATLPGLTASLCLVLLLLAAPRAIAQAADSAELKRLFANPPREYSSAPLWVWNDMLTEEQVVSTLRDLAAQNVKQAFVHPRPGLMTPYLSPAWFKLWKAALAEAEKLDMNLWIYDENSYPSGFAGGFVPDAMPESRGVGLGMKEAKQAPAWTGDLIAVFVQEGDKCTDVSARLKAGEKLPDAAYLVFTLLKAGDSPWHGNRCYVDLMRPGVTEKFIEVTLEAYKREIGDQFGKRVPGTFTDEPNVNPAGGLPWTEGLPAEFQKRWGYSLLENLPSLYRKVGDWKRVRHNYYQVVLEQFIEHWAKPLHDWCEQNHLEFTGHYWEHEWPHAAGVPDNMAMAAWHQRPAIDILMNQYSEDVHAQFGNVRAVKELSSVANQLGYKRTLCEAYGAAGWDSRFEDYKRIGDWMYALGVNTLDQHLSYITLRGARKRDHPQSFGYYEPWWEAYGVQGRYFERLSLALSAGEEVNNILVIEPTTTAWMYNADGEDDPQLTKIGAEFQKFVTDLAKHQVEFDLGCEDIIARHGFVTWAQTSNERNGTQSAESGADLSVGRRHYGIVVLPGSIENLASKTVELLDEYLQHGGRVYCVGSAPTRQDGVESATIVRLAKYHGWVPLDVKSAISRLEFDGGGTVVVSAETLAHGILLHQTRLLRDRRMVFLVNASADAPAKGAIIGHDGFARLDPCTGEVRPYRPCPISPDARFPRGFHTGAPPTIAGFDIPPAGSLLLVISDGKTAELPDRGPKESVVASAGPPQIRRIAPNVLTLDYVDVTAGGETKQNEYFYSAGQFVWQKNGLPRNPWDSAVQFKDELISHKFPADSGFDATYRFTIEGAIPADLAIVIERTDLYTITCNGQPVSARPGQWWLDRAFGKLDIAKLARTGANEVTIKATPMTMFHELECAYVLGDFDLKATDHGFVIVPSAPLKLGKWNELGAPFYAQGVAYTQKFDVPATPKSEKEPTAGAEPGRYRVRLPSWYGSVAKVAVNGEPAGYIFSQPYECDVDKLIKPGQSNVIEVTVIGTLKNTLGPHHGNPPLGTAWPAMWRKAPNPGPPPGQEYSNVGYGLFEPFVLINVRE